ncbi:NAD-P-binding protein [Gautieria morchelliformis]|nr:NAD-P-binding protein [Gautieria morchelliformis]
MPAPSENLKVTARHDVYPGIDPKHHYDAQTFKGKVEIARSYARAGASVILVARSQATLDSVKSTINLESPNASVLVVAADVVHADHVQAAVQAAVAKFGKLDIAIANAGKADPWGKALTDIDPNSWWMVMDVNIRGVYNVAHFCLPHLDQSKGHFVTISSGAAQLRIPSASHYCVSKHAIGRFNEFIAMEHPDIKTFAVHPGAIPTDMSKEVLSASGVTFDSIRLPAATLMRLTSGRDNYLSGKYVSTTWDLDEVEEKYKEKIIQEEALVSRLAIPLL